MGQEGRGLQRIQHRIQFMKKCLFLCAVRLPANPINDLGDPGILIRSSNCPLPLQKRQFVRSVQNSRAIGEFRNDRLKVGFAIISLQEIFERERLDMDLNANIIQAKLNISGD